MKNLVLSVICAVLFSACSSTYSLWYADKRIRNLSIGMSRNEVIQVMGKSYLVNASSKDANGNLVEVLAYKSSADEEYRLNFNSNRLESWNRVHLREHIRPEMIQTPPAKD